jgi:hypothetical protein
MPRTSKSTVKKTIDTSLSDDAIDDWIAVAADLVDQIESRSDLSSGRLEHIETLVAQHFLSGQDQRHASESGASRSVEYQGETGMFFEGTKHGQRALMLDPTGVLANANEPDDFTLSI